MATDTLRELRADAKRLGVPWREVCQLKNELVQQEREQRELTDGPRRRAWELFSSPGCHAFWRCGWEHTRRRIENSGRDFTSLRGFDEIHRGVAEEYPEWASRNAAELFAWLFEPYQPWPARIQFYEQALAVIEATSIKEQAGVPF